MTSHPDAVLLCNFPSTMSLLHIVGAKQGTSNQMLPWNMCHWSYCCLEYLPCSQ